MTTIDGLQSIMASISMLANQTKQFHWCIKSQSFIELHEMFGNVWWGLIDMQDSIAEFIRSIKYYPVSTMSEYIKYSVVSEEQNYDTITDVDMINKFYNDTMLIYNLCDMYAQKSTNLLAQNFILGISEQILKMSWKFDSYRTQNV